MRLTCRGCPAVRHSATPHLVAATTDLRGGTGVMAGGGSGEDGGAKWWWGREGGGEGGKSAGFDAWTQTSAARLISSRVGELKLGHGA